MMEKISTFLQNKNSKFLQSLGILVVLILIATPVIATAPAPVDPIAFLGRVIEFARNILFAVAALFIIFGAFTFVTAQGDDKKIETGRKAILYALIAVAVAVLAHGLVIWVRDWAGRV